MPQDEQQGPHPAAVGFVWKAVGTVAVPIAIAALILWRDAALTNARVDDLSRAQLATADALTTHVNDERARVAAQVNDERARAAAQTTEERNAAVAQARLETSLTSLRTTLDAILQALARRR